MPVAGSTAVQEPSIGFSCAVALLAPAAAATTQARPPTRRTAAERGLLMAVSPSGKAGARRGPCRGNDRHERRGEVPRRAPADRKSGVEGKRVSGRCRMRGSLYLKEKKRQTERTIP